MPSRLVNVRLDEERVRKAQRLREHGVAISDLVREAIDERFDALRTPRDAGEARSAIARLLERHRWIAYIGLLIILYVALDMIYRGAMELWPVVNAAVAS